MLDLYFCTSDSQMAFHSADCVGAYDPGAIGAGACVTGRLNAFISPPRSLPEQPVSLVEYQPAGSSFIATTYQIKQVKFVGGDSVEVPFAYDPGGHSEVVLEMRVDPTIAESPGNNRITRVFRVGANPPNEVDILLHGIAAGCGTTRVTVDGSARYQAVDGGTDLGSTVPVICGSVTATLQYAGSGPVIITLPGGKTDERGGFGWYVDVPGGPLAPGSYEVVVTVSDGTEQSTIVLPLRCDQPAPPIQAPPDPSGSCIYSEHIAFLGDANCLTALTHNPYFNTSVGVPQTISIGALPHYFGPNLPAAQDVSFYSQVPIGNGFVQRYIGTVPVDPASSGGIAEACMPWTPTDPGAQIVQVVLEPFQGDFELDNAATKIIHIGEVQCELEIDASRVFVNAGSSGNVPFSGRNESGLSVQPDLSIEGPPNLGLPVGLTAAIHNLILSQTSYSGSIHVETDPTMALGYYRVFVISRDDSCSSLDDFTLLVGNTPAGTNVSVTPEDSATGTSPVDVTFETRTTPGITTVLSTDIGIPSPQGYLPVAQWEIRTDSDGSGLIHICADYDESAVPDESRLRLYHFSNGTWVDVTDPGGLDVIANQICGTADSLSPFGIFRPANLAPTADAGPDQAVDEGVQVTLDGSGSSDPDTLDTLVYSWSQVAGTTVLLDTTDPIHPTFVAPYVQIGGETLTFELVVSDGQLTSALDYVSVTVANVNHPPFAAAGADQTVSESMPVTLDGSASYDEDHDPLTYSWSQNGGPTVVLSDASAAMPTFTSPTVGTTGAILTFELTVSDGFESSVDSVTITVEHVNHAPTVSAGPSETFVENAQVILMGATASDPDNDPLAVVWSQVSGPPVALVNFDTLTPSFTTPEVSAGGATILFEILVTDTSGATASDTRTVQVEDSAAPPSCVGARPSVSLLWPPNHKLVPVTIEGLRTGDDDDRHGDDRDDEHHGHRNRRCGQGHVTITILDVTQDEPINGLGNGDTAPDAVIRGETVLLRAERSGTGNGRVYHIHFLAEDEVGGMCIGEVTVCVPHDNRHGGCGHQHGGTDCIDDGQLYDSLGS